MGICIGILVEAFLGKGRERYVRCCIMVIRQGGASMSRTLFAIFRHGWKDMSLHRHKQTIKRSSIKDKDIQVHQSLLLVSVRSVLCMGTAHDVAGFLISVQSCF